MVFIFYLQKNIQVMKQFQYLLFICQALLFLLPLTGTAQVSEEGAVKKTIELFFEGFHQKDAQILTQTTDSLFTLNSVGNRGGKVVTTQTSGNAFVKAVLSRADSPTWNEKLLSFNIKIDGALAHAWVGYEFWLGDTFSHCGINSIHLMKQENAWKIINITDSRRRADCR